MVGNTVSHYKILDKLGSGGMGVVYKAHDLKLDRVVALKFLTPQLVQDPTEKLRFILEARAASALDHPGICTIYEIDQTPEGDIFIAMAAYEGSTLDKLIQQGPLPFGQVIDLALQTTAGVNAAHAKGIIHRDLKTTNIMVTDGGRVKILDFGLARLPGAMRLTNAGSTIGTVPYISPEQARGEDVDHRTDIWSLGVILYEMISGKLPFHSAYSDALIYSILNESPTPLTSLRNDMPRELERIVGKALQKDKSSRYQQVEDMMSDLNKVQKESPAPGSHPSPGTAHDVPRKRTRVHWGIPLVIGCTIGALMLILKLTGSGPGSPVPRVDSVRVADSRGMKRSIAVLPFKNLTPDKEEEYFCDGMTEQIISNLSNVQDLKVIARTSVMQFKSSDAPIPRIAQQLGVENILEGSIRKSGNRIRVSAQLIEAGSGFLLWAKDYDREMKDIFAVQDDVSKAIVAALKLNISGQENFPLGKSHTQNTEAYQLYLKGMFYWNKRTEDGLLKGITYFSQTVAVDPSYALAYAGLADSYGVLGYYNWLPPGEAFPKAREAAFKALEIDSTLSEGHAALAIVLRDYDWDWKGAEREFLRAIELNPGDATARLWYANFLDMMKRPAEGYAEMTRALELDPLSLIINADLGRTLYFLRRYGESADHLRKTIDMDANFEVAHIWLGQVLEESGNINGAIAEFLKGVDLSRHSSIAVARLAHAYAQAGRTSDAEALLHQLIDQPGGRYVSSYDIAIIYAGFGDTGNALTWLEKAYNERSHWLGFMLVDPTLDSLRNQPRFALLLKRMGLGR